MRIHENNARRYRMHGNNQLPPIDRMTISPDTYCVRAIGCWVKYYSLSFTDIGGLSFRDSDNAK